MSKSVWWLGSEVSDGGEIRLYRDDCQRGFCYDKYSEELRRILKRAAAKPKVCVWTLDVGEGVVETECGKTIGWSDDPRSKAHGIRYCHSCGGAVQWRVAK